MPATVSATAPVQHNVAALLLDVLNEDEHTWEVNLDGTVTVPTADGDDAVIWHHKGMGFGYTVYTYRANRETWWNDETERAYYDSAAEALADALAFTAHED
jgi:hypothetical protein